MILSLGEIRCNEEPDGTDGDRIGLDKIATCHTLATPEGGEWGGAGGSRLCGGRARCGTSRRRRLTR